MRIYLLFPVTRLGALVKSSMAGLAAWAPPISGLHLTGYGFTGMRITEFTTPVTRMYLGIAVLSSPAFSSRKP